MFIPTSRSDRRMRKEVAVELARPDSSHPREMAIAENVSTRGMRVATHDIWLPGARVLLTSPGFGVDTRARVVYCQHLGNDRFAIGLEFLVPCNGPSRISSSRESFRNVM
jgi:hypothetical protein